jgi:hypothetical protein
VPRSALHHVALIAATAAGFACASSTGGAVTPSGAPAPARTDRTVITTEELKNTGETNLYNVIQRLRPDWLRSRGPTSFSQTMAQSTGAEAISVYQDMQRLGTVDVLKGMTITQATSLKFYSASDAQMRFGTGNQSGAIQILVTP